MSANFNAISLLGRVNKEPVGITDKEWQQMFSLLKLTTPVSKEKRFRNTVSSVKVNGMCQQEKEETQWRYYIQYINNVLSNIRNGEHDVCFFSYQIKDLLKFENTRLKTKLINDNGFVYFDVWLDKNNI